MKKLLCIILILTIILNFISINICYGIDGDPTFKLENDASPTEGEAESQIQDGGMSFGDFGNAILSLIVGLIGAILDVVAGIPFVLINMITNAGATTDNPSEGIFLSIGKIVFNEVPLFNIDYFNFETQYEVGLGENTKQIKHVDMAIDEVPLFGNIDYESPNILFKKSVAQWFIIIRMLAVIISLGVLIYVGIRMALSTVASEQAKYKKMLTSWVESIIILFTLPYIIQAVIYLGNFVTNICVYFKIWLEQEVIGFEDYILTMLMNSLTELAGYSFAFYSILFCFLVYVQVKFFWVYIKRFLIMGFLIVISPLITVTYSLDKIGDEKAQAFSLWFKELLVNIFVQPLHAMIYLIFIFTAGEIAKQAPIIALIFLVSMGRIEKMVKTIFSMRGMISVKSVDDLTSKK